MTDHETRSRGVTLGQLTDDLADASFPMDVETLRAEFGDRKVEVGAETKPLDDVLAPLDATQFESPAAVEETLLNLVDDDALDREGYSDRGGSTQGVETDEQSL